MSCINFQVLGRESVRYEVNDKVVKKTLNSLIETQGNIYS